jgi:hypothetical protein
MLHPTVTMMVLAHRAPSGHSRVIVIGSHAIPLPAASIGGEARDARPCCVVAPTCHTCLEWKASLCQAKATGFQDPLVASSVPQPSTVVQKDLMDPMCIEEGVVREEAERGSDRSMATTVPSSSLDDCMGNALSDAIPLAETACVLPDGPAIPVGPSESVDVSDDPRLHVVHASPDLLLEAASLAQDHADAYVLDYTPVSSPPFQCRVSPAAADSVTAAYLDVSPGTFG